MPREVIFFGRVVSCLRRDCELLGVDISCIDLWAPVARAALHAMVYDGPLIREPANLRTGLNDMFDENKDEDDRSMWSPSRLILVADTSKFEHIQEVTKYLQENPDVGDAALGWACEINDMCPSAIRLAGWVGKTKRPLVNLMVKGLFGHPILSLIFFLFGFLIFLKGLLSLW